MSPETKPVMDKKEAAEYLGLSLATLDRYMKSGALRFVKLQRAVRYRKEDLDAFLEAHLSTAETGPEKTKEKP